jgi:hypothetical protein
MRYWKGILRWPLAAVLAVGLAGCDLEVLNPGAVLDEDLNSPDVADVLVAGVSAEYNQVQDLLVMEVSRLTDDIASTGSYGSTQNYRQGIFDDRDSDGYWEQIHESIFAAGDAWARFQDVLPNAGSSALTSRLFALMGHGHNRLGENFCDVVYDIGGVQPRSASFDSAIVAFNMAIQIGEAAEAAGEDAEQWILSAYAGIAQAELGRASLGTGSWQAAFDAADDFFTAADGFGVENPEQWHDDAIYNAQANTNYVWNETHGRAEIGVWSTQAQQMHDATEDVRVPYTKCGEWKDDTRPNPDTDEGVTDLGCTSGSGAHQGADGLTANYRQDKYPDIGSNIPRVSGAEMRIIQAEAMLMMGDISDATGMTYYLNLARASYGDPADTGLDPLAEPAAVGELDFHDQYPHYAMAGDADWDAWSMLDAERYATVWLEGKRWFDIDRWQHPFLDGQYLAKNVPGAGSVAQRPSCMPIPRNECQLNPNITDDPACS